MYLLVTNDTNTAMLRVFSRKLWSQECNIKYCAKFLLALY